MSSFRREPESAFPRPAAAARPAHKTGIRQRTSALGSIVRRACRDLAFPHGAFTAGRGFDAVRELTGLVSRHKPRDFVEVTRARARDGEAGSREADQLVNLILVGHRIS